MKQHHKVSVQEFSQSLLSGNIAVLSKAITYLESTLLSDNDFIQQVIQYILPHTGNAFRLGITGVPGVGKSSLIEKLGETVLTKYNKLAVLAIDPSSKKSGGSILGDKTRMSTLSSNPKVFIRPSASGNYLGGIHRKTYETMLLCEAAGYDFILIETVGVGQSETAVEQLVDASLLVTLPNAGDDLQGIKRGIMESADIIAVNKADGNAVSKAQEAVSFLKSAVHFLTRNDHWTVPVLPISAQENIGIVQLFETIEQFFTHQKLQGFIALKRQKNQAYIFEEKLKEMAWRTFSEQHKNAIAEVLEQLEKKEISLYQAVDLLFKP